MAALRYVFFIYCVRLFPFAKFFSLFFIYVVLPHMLVK